MNKSALMEETYLQWVANSTPTKWWHDSADPAEIKSACANKAVGATTNPVLVAASLARNKEFWKEKIGTLSAGVSGEDKVDILLKVVVQYVAGIFESQFINSNGVHGYVCVQVSPSLAACRDSMIKSGRKYAGWAPNITVKFPATKAGLEALEECVAEGITITATVNFTVPQVIQVAEAYRRGVAKAQKAGRKPGGCFAVIMIGRIDDYLRDVSVDNKSSVRESDIHYAGIAITKRAYSIFKEEDYEAKLLVAALRGTHHMVELCGGDLVMSIHPTYQKELLKPDIPRELRIDNEVPQEAIDRLMTLPEFVKAYEPDGMKPEEFITFGVTQRTLTQFSISGWSAISSIVL